MIRHFVFAALFMFAGGFMAHSQGLQTNAAPLSEGPLAALQNLKIADGTIASVQRDDSPTYQVTGNQPRTLTNLDPRTILKIVLNPAKGSNINVEIWLPDQGKWNGRLLGLGNVGYAGHINELGFIGPVHSGYATVTSDMGTAPNADSGIGNREVWKDFGFRAAHLMTVVAKQVVETYYGKGPDYSYFTGGSTGGQEALQEAQRYPADYDGITAAIPAHCRTPLHAYFLWNYQILAACPFTKAQEDTVIAAANEYMASREVPAIAGKFISDPRCDSKDIEAVIALARQKDPSLTDAHAAALRKLFDGPKDPTTGERIFDGIPLGSTFEPASWNLYLFRWVFGATKKLREINFGADMDTYTAALGPYLNAENPDLTPFESRGGKLIMFAGSADSVVPYHVSIEYYEKVIAHFGSLDKVQSFFRFYIIPGLSHSASPGLTQTSDVLGLVRAWRENGTAPEALTGRRGAEPTMPIYPYPAKTGWDAATSTYRSVDGPRGGVGTISPRFLPPAAE
jgi:feruloyl esterase